MMKLLCRLAVRGLTLPFLFLVLVAPLNAAAWEDTNDFSWLKLIPPSFYLDSWGFDETNLDSDFGFAPLSFINIQQVPDWDGQALQVDNTNAAWLTYSILQNAPGYGQYTNLSLNDGTVEFWFIPNWESDDTNFYGTGPGDWGRLIEAGTWTTNAVCDWWSLYLNPYGTGIYFASGTNGARTNYLNAPISWDWNVWHLVDLTYSPTNTAIFIDGQLAATGDGARYVPSGDILTNGFAIGGDFATGMQQAHGQFDNLVTYNYQLSAGEVADDYGEAYAELPGTFHAMGDDEPPIPPGGGTSGGSGGGSGGAGGSFSFPTNGLWLWITNIAGGTVYADLHNGTDYVYEIFSATNLATTPPLPDWNVEAEVFPGTNTSVMPFTVPMNSRDSLFLSARDWTGITSGCNRTPEWWFYYWFGTTNLSDWDLDSIGNTLLSDYLNGINPIYPGTYDKPPEYIRPPYAFWNVTDISDPAQPVNIGVLQEPFSAPNYSGLTPVPLPNTYWHFNTSITLTSAFGTTEFGGNSNMGTVFEIGLNGGITNLHSFTSLDGAYPCSQLTISGSAYYGITNVLYGTTMCGGSNGYGTVFKLNSDGTGFKDLYEFAGTNDGKFPTTGLLIDGNTLYGTTSNSLYKISTCGCNFTCLTNITNASQLILSLSGDTLYGTTTSKGSYGGLFSVSTAGTNLTWLHIFTNGAAGALPMGGLEILECSNAFWNGSTTGVVFGTTCRGGVHSNGMVFSINTDGSGFTDLHDFESNIDGAYPLGGLLLTNNNAPGLDGKFATLAPPYLFGTTSIGGTNGGGTVFGMGLSGGTNFQTLYSFGGTNGTDPEGKLILLGQSLYGTTSAGGIGASTNGTIFSINTDGSSFTNLFDLSDHGAFLAGLTLPVEDNPWSIWSLDTTINVSAANLTNLSYSLAIDDSYALFVNGNLVSETNYDGAAFWPPFSPLPYLQPGANDIRVVIAGNGDLNDYFAMQITTPFTNTLVLTNAFGTTSEGAADYGAIFEILSNQETVLYSFAGPPTDGKSPIGDLVLSSNTLYGVTEFGGTNDTGSGIIFSIGTGGTNYQILHSFSDEPDGNEPHAGLTLSGNRLYGTTYEGGVGGGTMFSIDTSGSNYAVIYSCGTNNDGVNPAAPFVLVSNILYGTMSQNGPNGYGTIFSVSTNGSNYRTLHSFRATDYDGKTPLAGLAAVSNALSGITLYGTTYYGGTNSEGTIFSYNIGSSNYQCLHSFGSGPQDGANPNAGLALLGGTLYGTTAAGGAVGLGLGTVFSINVGGSNYTTLLPFGSSDTDNGQTPQADLLIQGSSLYGTTSAGGANTFGIVFGVRIDGGEFGDVYDFRGGVVGDGASPGGGLCAP